MERSHKEELVAEFSEIFKNSQSAVLVNYQGLTVEELTAIRKNLWNKQAHMRVIKNSLAAIASKGTPFESLADDFVHTRALVYSDVDAVGAAKVVTDAAKKNDKLEVISGVLVTSGKGQKLDLSGIKELGDLPSKEELLAKLLYVMNAPLTNFVRTLNEVPASFVRTVQAVADSKK